VELRGSNAAGRSSTGGRSTETGTSGAAGSGTGGVSTTNTIVNVGQASYYDHPREVTAIQIGCRVEGEWVGNRYDHEIQSTQVLHRGTIAW
jgi:hypothetical protein